MFGKQLKIIATLLLMFITIQSFTQTDTTTYSNHQVLILANGLKVEILKTRGTGLAEECDVIYYTTKRQEGKRMWQSVSRLQEEERAAQIAAEIANPKKSPSEVKVAKPIMPDKSVTNVKTVAAGNIKPPGSAFQESIKRSDSLAKARAKLIDSKILAQIEKENSEKDDNRDSADSTNIKGSQSNKEEDNSRIVPNTVKADDAPLKIDIIQPELKPPTVVQIQETLESDTASEETFVKSYGKPITKTITPNPSASALQKPAEVKEEKKAELSPEAITFPEAPKAAELRFEPLISTACLMISIYDSTVVSKAEQKKSKVVIPLVVSNFVTAPLTIAPTYKIIIDNSSVRINRQQAIKNVSHIGSVSKYNLEPLSIAQIYLIKVNNSSVSISQRKQIEKRQIPSIVATDYSTVPLTQAILFTVKIDKNNVRIIQLSAKKILPVSKVNKDQAGVELSSNGGYEKVAEVKVNGVWKKAKVKEEKTVYLYKVQVEGSLEDEWIPHAQIRNLDSVKSSDEQITASPRWNNNIAGCSFVPMPSFSMQSTFSNRIVKRMIYDKQVEAAGKGIKVGINFIRLMNKEAFVNEIKITKEETLIKYPSAPPGAMIFPIITQYKVCEQIQGKIRSRTEEAQYSFFRNKDGVWSCIKDK